MKKISVFTINLIILLLCPIWLPPVFIGAILLSPEFEDIRQCKSLILKISP